MDSTVLAANRENIMNAQATQAKKNLLTRARVSTLTAQEFSALLAGELAKIESRPAPKSAAALERHEATIAGYQAAITELTQPVEVDLANDAPLVAVMAGGEFVGVVAADTDVNKLASDAGLRDISVVKSCGLCSAASDVPAGAKIIYSAAWDEVIKSDAGHQGKIVWSLA